MSAASGLPSGTNIRIQIIQRQLIRKRIQDVKSGSRDYGFCVAVSVHVSRYVLFFMFYAVSIFPAVGGECYANHKKKSE